LRDNNNPTIIPVPRRWASRPDCRCLPIQIVALQLQKARCSRMLWA
jgi:hypothetical protein